MGLYYIIYRQEAYSGLGVVSLLRIAKVLLQLITKLPYRILYRPSPRNLIYTEDGFQCHKRNFRTAMLYAAIVYVIARPLASTSVRETLSQQPIVRSSSQVPHTASDDLGCSGCQLPICRLSYLMMTLPDASSGD